MNIHEAYTIYNNSLDSMDPLLAEAIDRIIDNKAMEIHRLREALEFYADESNHDDHKPYCENCLNSPIDYDKGKIARKALEGDKQ